MPHAAQAVVERQAGAALLAAAEAHSALTDPTKCVCVQPGYGAPPPGYAGAGYGAPPVSSFRGIKQPNQPHPRRKLAWVGWAPLHRSPACSPAASPSSHSLPQPSYYGPPPGYSSYQQPQQVRLPELCTSCFTSMRGTGHSPAAVALLLCCVSCLRRRTSSPQPGDPLSLACAGVRAAAAGKPGRGRVPDGVPGRPLLLLPGGLPDLNNGAQGLQQALDSRTASSPPAALLRGQTGAFAGPQPASASLSSCITTCPCAGATLSRCLAGF